MKKITLIGLVLVLSGCQQANQAVEKVTELVSMIGKPSKEEILKHLGSDNCYQEFITFLDYEPIKAFATASDTSCGWSGSNMETVEAAKAEALQYCEENRESGTPCVVVNVDGKWQN
jgi:hypothetical protein